MESVVEERVVVTPFISLRVQVTFGVFLFSVMQ